MSVRANAYKPRLLTGRLVGRRVGRRVGRCVGFFVGFLVGRIVCGHAGCRTSVGERAVGGGTISTYLQKDT